LDGMTGKWGIPRERESRDSIWSAHRGIAFWYSGARRK
jgi:hypothetical protein